MTMIMTRRHGIAHEELAMSAARIKKVKSIRARLGPELVTPLRRAYDDENSLR